jgi:hypothetical protein
LRKQAAYGLTLLKQEKAFNEQDQAIRFVNGDQFPIRSKAADKTCDNRLRKILQETVSCLTDVRPIWNYETNDEQYKKQAEILNKLARGWWKNSLADRKLQSTLTWSCVGGSGYASLTFDKDLPGGGDLVLTPYDPRDVIPIDPVFGDSIQEWRGVILRQRLPQDTLKKLYPLKAGKIISSKGSWFGPPIREGGALFNVATSMWDMLTRSPAKSIGELPGVDVMKIYLKDDTLNIGNAPITVGDPTKGDSYIVHPLATVLPDQTVVDENKARLYPRGRFIVCTPDAILYDGPNPHWHGLIPIVRFTLDPLPWSLLGASIIGDLVPMQNNLNESIRGWADGVAQWIRRGVKADRRAISKAALDELDTRKGGLKIHFNPAMGEGIEILPGPDPAVLDSYLKNIEYLKGEMDELSGMKGINQLMAMGNSAPSEETIDKYMDVLSPVLRLRARAIEVSLSELAELLKVGFFQYYSAPRRLQMLGKDGLSLEDFDYDPGSLIPSDAEGVTREERAQTHHKNFTFSISQNSFLNVSHTTKKMLDLQLLREQLMDPWTVWNAFDTQGVGPLPAETVPERIVVAKRLGLLQGPTPEMVSAQQNLMLTQIQAQLQQIGMQMFAQNGPGMLPPGGGEGGPPQNAGQGAQGGRPPSGQEVPHFETRDGGTRQIVSESA